MWTALNLLPVDGHDSPGAQTELATKYDELGAAGRIAAGSLSRRKSAIVLKSGMSRPVRHILGTPDLMALIFIDECTVARR